jgi:hypothetical protein
MFIIMFPVRVVYNAQSCTFNDKSGKDVYFVQRLYGDDFFSCVKRVMIQFSMISSTNDIFRLYRCLFNKVACREATPDRYKIYGKKCMLESYFYNIFHKLFQKGHQ